MQENILLEFDKAGAEWVVVAYISGDANMLEVVRSGESPHVATGHLITGAPKHLIVKEDKLLGKLTDADELLRRRESDPELRELLALPFIPRVMTIRQGGKKSNHGLNYGMKYRRFALENEIPEPEALQLVELYSTVAYPGIVTGYWEPIRNQLRKNRTLTNCFGRKVRLVGEWGAELFDKAYSFVPQSTVGDTVNRAIRDAYEDDTPVFRMSDLLTQTHDSATYQFPVEDFTKMAEFAIRFGLGYMNPEMEYGGRKFQIGTDLKIGFDWSDSSLTPVHLTEDVKYVAEQLEATTHKLVADRAVQQVAAALGLGSVEALAAE